ncbi:hypothetical protein MTX26_34145 [Bradyrhizobium sp. ISRA443]|uniref:hypothetical protein n=1 Tax=unclassified Bradyrhizobium TaxID=2631580 RepID=UPI0024791036|nr:MULTISPECIES: hypothetical protein [unclassified Bradyrhizobium]WGR94441.1 hypothetical protein MTX20_09255 [Bradyrhizobium sp. ISRA435]WGR99168.1 hypothetical protein MTX23_34125 [Bradyrhizobium sp. ISRA436]WGS06059.1 hypothetical protein MTX18_34145 [Bradyrhizobium sp. ISRA437]WGS12945.1 hypothetical protein MTX26_34145 [Bradyrhizobium sp. ISRA443]
MIEETSERKEGPGGGVAADHGTAEPCGLSVRAMNVLKELAVELRGEVPPKTGWSPSDDLLRALTARHLATARNCGPQTTREIVDWAQARGISIPSPHHTGKSLSVVWGDLIERASAGRLTRSEITEALEKSIRRRSPRIPVAFQIVLLKILSSSYDQWPQP